MTENTILQLIHILDQQIDVTESSNFNDEIDDKYNE